MPPDTATPDSLTLGSVATDVAAYTTVLNPFWTSRVGTTGWDPARSPIFSRLNRILAPGASTRWKTVKLASTRYQQALDMERDVIPAARRGAHRQATRASAILGSTAGHERELSRLDQAGRRVRAQVPDQFRAISQVEALSVQQSRVKGKIARARGRAARVLHSGVAALEQVLGTQRELHRGANVAARRLGLSGAAVHTMSRPATGVGAAATRLVGEPGWNEMDRHFMKQARDRHGRGKWISGLTTPGQTHSSLMYGLGRGMTAVATGMLVYDAARLAMAPVSAIASIGLAARSAPTSSTGSGIAEPLLAASLRQQAIASMQSSAWGPRSVIGNEAPFLHV